MRRALALLILVALALPALAAPSRGPTPAPRANPAHATLDSLVQAMVKGRSAPQESVATVILRRAERAQPPDTSVMTHALQAIGYARWSRKAFRDSVAITSLARAIDLDSHRRVPDTLSIASAEHMLGRVLFEQGRSDDALPHLRRALALRIAATGGVDTIVAENWYSIGLAQRRLRRQAEALEALEHARSLRARLNGAMSPQVAYVLAELGGTLLDMGRYGDARDTLTFANRINDATLAPDDEGRVYPLNLLSSLHYHTGDIASSIEDLQKGLDVEIRAHGEQDVRTQPFRYNLALRLVDLGEFAQARALLADALASFEATYGPAHFRSSTVRMLLGVTEALEGDTTKARHDLETARDASARSDVDPNGARSHCDRWLAYLASSRGEFGPAKQLLDEALAIEQASPTPSFEILAALYELRESVAQAAGDAALLASTIRGIDTLVTDSAHVSNVGFATLLHARALAHEHLGHSADAWRDASRAEAMDLQHHLLNTRALPDRQALALATTASQSLDVMIRLAARGDDAQRRAAWDRLIRRRGLVAAEVERRRAPPDAARDPSLAAAHAKWLDAQQEYAQAMVADAGDTDSATTARVTALRNAAEAAERDYARLPRARDGAPASTDAGLADVLRHLAPDAALIGACEIDAASDTARMMAFVARGAGGAVQLLDLGRSAPLRASLRRWLAVLSTPPEAAGAARAETRARALGAALEARTWDRLAAAAGGAREWYVAGDGPLLELPWQALPEGTDRYVIETGPLVHGLDAERELAVAAPAAPARGLLAIGGPRFDATLAAAAAEPLAAALRGPLGTCDLSRSLELPSLPAARAEAVEAGRTWTAAHPETPATVLTDDAATETAFKREAPGRQVIHLATHGIVWSDSCRPAVRDLRGVGGVDALEEPAPAHRRTPHPSPRLAAAPGFAPRPSPWLGRQTWLALAGADHARHAGSGGDDGLLTAEEVMTLDLRGVDWVVLSACQSGVGDTWPHEGAEGMRRAFRLAGAHTVIASQWSLADEPAREWVHALYTARASGTTDAAAAMREASRAFLAARRAAHRTTHPFYWASFIASGR